MDAQRALAACISKNLDRVARVRVHGRHDPARAVGADGDEAEVEGPARGADLREGGAVRQGGKGRRPVVLAVGGLGHGAVAGVAAEEDGVGAGLGGGGGEGGGDGPAGPEGFGAVEGTAGGDVLAG